MKKTAVSTDRGPKAIGPYSQAIKVPGLMFVSGQTPLDPKTGQMVGNDVKEQTVRVLDNIQGILESQGLSMADVVKTTVFLKDMNDFAAMNEIYAGRFPAPAPARSTIQVARLPKDALVEIEAVVVLD
ncbi:MAG TPA: RidA family protein [Bacillota bacterium]|nr:RidA family protein [Bacillota bacterium]HOH10542.1 RidA family protein [Bacillota bacterium]HOS49927.1 RidA family protein [Bacillota bacterium]HOY89206.1 RidA family protein [Bacillota bacterium]HPI01545.1 RidA family protein [Bacillota bacterium]